MLVADMGRVVLIGLLALLAVPSTPVWLLFALLFLAELLSAPSRRLALRCSWTCCPIRVTTCAVLG